MRATQVRAIAAVVAAILAAIQAQPDVAVPPVAKLVIVALLAGLAAADWGAIFGESGEA